MKELGNLAIVCARRPDVLMQIYDGMVSVHAEDPFCPITLSMHQRYCSTSELRCSIDKFPILFFYISGGARPGGAPPRMTHKLRASVKG